MTDTLTQSILLYGSIAGACTAIVVAIVKLVRAAKNGVQWFTDLKKSVDTLIEHDHVQYMAILRLTVMSDNIPLSERINAGKEYLREHGNGDVEQYYNEVLKPHDTILKD